MHFALEQKTKKLTGTKMGMNYKENKLFKSMNPCRGGSASEFHQITFSQWAIDIYINVTTAEQNRVDGFTNLMKC